MTNLESDRNCDADFFGYSQRLAGLSKILRRFSLRPVKGHEALVLSGWRGRGGVISFNKLARLVMVSDLMTGFVLVLGLQCWGFSLFW